MSQLSSFWVKINVVGKAAGILTITLECLHKHNKLKGKHLIRIKYATNIIPLTYQFYVLCEFGNMDIRCSMICLFP